MQRAMGLDNGVSICYTCHNDIEKIGAKLRLFILSRQSLG
jgi:hypothetical protein